jgi:hypothetical protein
MLTQRSGLDALSFDDLQRLLAMAEAAVAAGGWDALTPAAEAAQRAAIGQEMTDQPPLFVGPVAA